MRAGRGAWVAALIALPMALAGCGGASAPAETALPAGLEGPYEVVEVVDGDTVKVRVDGRPVTVRLLGIDTPETHDPRRPVECFGREASRRAEQLLAGREVLLEGDPTQGGADRYGRRLAYVWLPGPPAELVNERLVAEGYAHEYTYAGPHRYAARFDAAQAAAREGDRGLWSPQACAGRRAGVR